VLIGIALRFGQPHRGHLDAGHLELGCRAGTEVRRLRVIAGDHVGQHDGLLPERSHQAVDLAAMLHTLPYGEDVVVVDGAHLVVDHDRPLDGEPARRRDVGVRPDAGCHHDEVAVDLGLVPQPHALDLVGTPDRGCPVVGEDADAELGHAAAEHFPAFAPKLGIHQPASGVDDVDVDSVTLQTPRCLQSEQAAADHHGATVIITSDVVDHAAGVVDSPEGEHARK